MPLGRWLLTSFDIGLYLPTYGSWICLCTNTDIDTHSYTYMNQKTQLPNLLLKIMRYSTFIQPSMVPDGIPDHFKTLMHFRHTCLHAMLIRMGKYTLSTNLYPGSASFISLLSHFTMREQRLWEGKRYFQVHNNNVQTCSLKTQVSRWTSGGATLGSKSRRSCSSFHNKASLVSFPHI